MQVQPSDPQQSQPDGQQDFDWLHIHFSQEHLELAVLNQMGNGFECQLPYPSVEHLQPAAPQQSHPAGQQLLQAQLGHEQEELH